MSGGGERQERHCKHPCVALVLNEEEILLLEAGLVSLRGLMVFDAEKKAGIAALMRRLETIKRSFNTNKDQLVEGG